MEKKFKFYYCTHATSYYKSFSEIAVSTEEKKNQLMELLKSEGYEIKDKTFNF